MVLLRLLKEEEGEVKSGVFWSRGYYTFGD